MAYTIGLVVLVLALINKIMDLLIPVAIVTVAVLVAVVIIAVIGRRKK